MTRTQMTDVAHALLEQRGCPAYDRGELEQFIGYRAARKPPVSMTLDELLVQWANEFYCAKTGDALDPGNIRNWQGTRQSAGFHRRGGVRASP